MLKRLPKYKLFSGDMKYSDNRHIIKSGDVLAWSHHGGWFKSWSDFKIHIVRLFQRSEYSHVGTAWVFCGRVWVLESVIPVPRAVPLSNLLPCYHINVPDLKWDAEVEQYALSFIGNKNYRYSAWEAVKGFFGKTENSDKALQCAKFVQLICSKAGVNLTGFATPSDVVLAVQELGGELTYLQE